MSIAGQVILVAEDEPLVALEIAETFERLGARVVTTRTRTEALSKSKEASAAILDWGLADGDGQALGGELQSRGIPFVVYSGYPKPDQLIDAVYVSKPANPTTLVEAVSRLLDGGSATGGLG